ncbi:MAG TPA: hypothetical protein VK196_20210 [Magnetospirillum sp.]|nr:hypothetical protein [Magnetospirillum sp.]
MKPITRTVLGILGIGVTIAAGLALAASGTCTGNALMSMDGPGSLAGVVLMLSIPAFLLSLLALVLGVRLSRWGLRAPREGGDG